MKIILISCVSCKLPVPSRAKELYTSPLFVKSRNYAETHSDAWFILSAKYGLVHPDDMIQPYNKTLNDMKKQERIEWTNAVFSKLKPRVSSPCSFTVLAGKKYREFLVPLLASLCGNVFIPMEGLTIGKQLKWLNDNT